MKYISYDHIARDDFIDLAFRTTKKRSVLELENLRFQLAQLGLTLFQFTPDPCNLVL